MWNPWLVFGGVWEEYATKSVREGEGRQEEVILQDRRTMRVCTWFQEFTEHIVWAQSFCNTPSQAKAVSCSGDLTVRLQGLGSQSPLKLPHLMKHIQPWGVLVFTSTKLRFYNAINVSKYSIDFNGMACISIDPSCHSLLSVRIIDQMLNKCLKNITATDFTSTVTLVIVITI